MIFRMGSSSTLICCCRSHYLIEDGKMMFVEFWQTLELNITVDEEHQLKRHSPPPKQTIACINDVAAGGYYHVLIAASIIESRDID